MYHKDIFLQERERCHLANKLGKQQIFYCKQNMKIKIASQLVSLLQIP